MPSINMIAARRADKRRQEQNIRKIIYAVAGEVGVVIIAVTITATHLIQTNSRISDLTAQINKLQPRVNEIQQLAAETTKMIPKVKTLDGAKADTLYWYNNLYAVTNCLPPQTWLTSLGANGAGGGSTPGTVGMGDPTFNISGVALDQMTVGTTMLRMGQSPNLDHVDLSFVQGQKTGDVTTVSFQMTVHLKPEQAVSASATQGGASDVQKS